MIFSFQDIANGVSAVLARKGEKAIPIRGVDSAEFQKSPESFVSAEQAAWLKACDWEAKAGSHALLPGKNGIEGNAEHGGVHGKTGTRHQGPGTRKQGHRDFGAHEDRGLMPHSFIW